MNKTEKTSKMKTCENGHFFDYSKNDTCQYCNQSPKSKLFDIQDETEKETKVYMDRSNNRNETRMIFRNSRGEEEKMEQEMIYIAGWIVITSKKSQGKSFILTYGMNKIGRQGRKNHISIDNGDDSISRENHASISYDFENNKFFIQHQEGKFLTYLNKQLVGGLTELNAYDKIKIGKTELIFVPLCGEQFQWKIEEE